LDACFEASAALPPVTMTSTLSRANSAASSAQRSARPSAQRYWIATVRDHGPFYATLNGLMMEATSGARRTRRGDALIAPVDRATKDMMR
jgi:hypothetical protein